MVLSAAALSTEVSSAAASSTAALPSTELSAAALSAGALSAAGFVPQALRPSIRLIDRAGIIMIDLQFFAFGLLPVFRPL